MSGAQRHLPSRSPTPCEASQPVRGQRSGGGPKRAGVWWKQRGVRHRRLDRRLDSGSGPLLAPTRRRSVTSARKRTQRVPEGQVLLLLPTNRDHSGSDELGDVDHLFPHVLQRLGLLVNLDGIWNLVLACPTCNRGPRGKWARRLRPNHVARLNRRNEHLIASQHRCATRSCSGPVRHQWRDIAFSKTRLT